LKKVVIMEHAPRFDKPDVDPSGLKPKLADFTNSTLTQMWHSSAMRDRIVIGKHSLSCNEDNKVAMYRDDWSGKFDGVHLYGSHGRKTYTASVLNILKMFFTLLPLPSH
jgi:hypothetical protein